MKEPNRLTLLQECGDIETATDMAIDEAKEALSMLKKKRGGQAVIDYVLSNDFFEAPASTKYHGSHKGGLVIHSVGVLRELRVLNHDLKLMITPASLVIIGLLHDLSKADFYKKSEKVAGTYVVGARGRTHSAFTVDKLKHLGLRLSKLEDNCIRYHMGEWGAVESGSRCSEYLLRERIKAIKDTPEVYWVGVADMTECRKSKLK